LFCIFNRNRNRNRKLDIPTAPTKAKSRVLVYSQALIQNQTDRQRIRSNESGGYGGWCLKLRQRGTEVERSGLIRIEFVEEECLQFGVTELWRDTCSKR